MFKYMLSLLILSSVFIGYWPVLLKLTDRWASGDNNYCYLIVPLFLYLCWEKKESFRFGEFTWSPLGIFAALPALGIIFLGELGSVETLLFAGIWGVIVAGCIMVYGKRTIFLVFPLLILFFIVPLPPFVNKLITFKMKLLASSMSASMLRAVGISVLLEGNILDLGFEKMQVVDACSGLRYLASLVLMALLINYYMVRGLWRWGVVMAMIAPLMLLVNALRIFLTGVSLNYGFTWLTRGSTHDTLGLVFFLLAGALLFATARLLRGFGIQDKTDKTDKGSVSTTGVFWPHLLTGVFFLVVTGSGYALQNIPAEPTHPPRESFSSFPMEVGGWKGEWHHLSKDVLESLWADDYVNATYAKKGSSGVIYLLIPFYGYQGTRHTAHAPQACLLGGGYELVKSRKRAVSSSGGKEVEIMSMVLEKGDLRMLGTYFFLQRGRVLTSPWSNKLFLLWDSITRSRTDGALVRVEMLVAPLQNLDDAYSELEEFISNILPMLETYVPS